MKVRYSLEAFAFAFVFYTSGLEAALIAGAVIVAGTLLGDTLCGMAGKAAGAVVGGAATAAALFFGLGFAGLANNYVPAIWVGILVAKHVYDGVEEASTGEILKQNYVALVILAAAAVVRELLGSGAVFGYEAGKFAVVSSSYLSNSFGLIFGGLGIAAANTILKKEGVVDSLWVAIPVVAVTAAASVSGGTVQMAAVTKSICSALIAVVLLVSVRHKMIFSTPGKHFAGLPVDMISLGFLTMMLSVIA